MGVGRNKNVGYLTHIYYLKRMRTGKDIEERVKEILKTPVKG
jgi:hypothetical protein